MFSRNRPSLDDESSDGSPPVAGLDGKVLEWILCYGCNRYGHVKKKDGIVNCPTWKEPNAPPKAVVEQVVGQGGAAPDIDIDALLKAAAMLDDGDENAAAVMKQMYLKYAEENKASKASVKMIRGRDALVLNVNAQGRERASGESFLAYVSSDCGMRARRPNRLADRARSHAASFDTTHSQPHAHVLRRADRPRHQAGGGSVDSIETRTRSRPPPSCGLRAHRSQ